MLSSVRESLDRGHQGSITSVALSESGDYVFTASTDSTLKQWDARSGELLHTYEGHSAAVNALVVLGNDVYSGSEDHTCRRWDAVTLQHVMTLSGHTAYVMCLCVYRDHLYSGSSDKTIRKWSLLDGRCEIVFHGHTEWISSVAIGLRGKLLYSGSGDSTVIEWDAENGHSLRLFPHPEPMVVRAVFVRDHERRLFSASSTGNFEVKEWDLTTGDCISCFNSARSVSALHVSEKHLVLSSEDEVFVRRKARQGSVDDTLFQRRDGDACAVRSIAVSDDSLLGASVDGVTSLYRFDRIADERVVSPIQQFRPTRLTDVLPVLFQWTVLILQLFAFSFNPAFDWPSGFADVQRVVSFVHMEGVFTASETLWRAYYWIVVLLMLLFSVLTYGDAYNRLQEAIDLEKVSRAPAVADVSLLEAMACVVWVYCWSLSTWFLIPVCGAVANAWACTHTSAGWHWDLFPSVACFEGRHVTEITLGSLAFVTFFISALRLAAVGGDSSLISAPCGLSSWQRVVHRLGRSWFVNRDALALPTAWILFSQRNAVVQQMIFAVIKAALIAIVVILRTRMEEQAYLMMCLLLLLWLSTVVFRRFKYTAGNTWLFATSFCAAALFVFPVLFAHEEDVGAADWEYTPYCLFAIIPLYAIMSLLASLVFVEGTKRSTAEAERRLQRAPTLELAGLDASPSKELGGTSSADSIPVNGAHGHTKSLPSFSINSFDMPNAEARCCDMCKKEESKRVRLYRCQGCRKTLYCGRECQTSHWTQGHAEQCATDRLLQAAPTARNLRSPTQERLAEERKAVE